MNNLEDENEIAANAVAQLASVFSKEEIPAEFSGDEREALWLAMQKVGNELGVEMNRPTDPQAYANPHALIMGIAHESQIRIRKIALKGEWWTYDNGPLLAYDMKTNSPVALIQRQHHYEIYEPVTAEYLPLDPERISILSPEGYMFYPTFPEHALGLFSIVSFAFKRRKSDLSWLLLSQLCIGILGLIVPIATGTILNTVIPNTEIGVLWQWVIVLMACAYATAHFNMAQVLSLIRLRFKIDGYVQAAVWDRLLRLPVPFFKKFSPGDLAVRASGIDTIQQELTDATMHALLGGIFSIITLGLMFYYSPLLTVVAVGLLLIVVILMVLNAVVQLKYQRAIAALQGKLATLTLQFLTSISKLRVSHGETRAYALWARQFAYKCKLFYKSSLWLMHFSVSTTILPLLGTAAIFWLVGSRYVNISFGEFIAFNAAYGQFFVALLAFSNIFIVLLRITPQYERIKPILVATPERDKEGLSVLGLMGKIAVREVSFRYHSDSPWVLRDVSLEVHPGEFIALAGSTGCGKSTLLRLLFGFETPNSGGIFYDGHNLETLNLRVVREQLGVVLQNDTLLPGTIFENIQGPHVISLEDAWNAVELAAFADEIKALPMGMHTYVSEGGITLSMGQRQRLMIARALARKPRILILDEAISAIDNPTQIRIMNALQQLKITRIVVAHRLNSISLADRIYIMENGIIKQQGNYESLSKEEGLFATLLQRQIL